MPEDKLQMDVDNETAQQSGEMTADEAAASLAFSTQLSAGMMTPEQIPTGEPEEGVEAEEQGEQETVKSEDLQQLEEKFSGEIESIRKEMKGGGMEDEIAQIRKELDELESQDNNGQES